MKAAVMEPSAKSRLRKLGRVKATAKASASQPVPMKAALVISRTRPSTRDAIVRRESFPPSRIKRPELSPAVITGRGSSDIEGRIREIPGRGNADWLGIANLYKAICRLGRGRRPTWTRRLANLNTAATQLGHGDGLT